MNFPKCPVCDDEVLVPFSAILNNDKTVVQKTFAHWLCLKCGFYVGTGRSKGHIVPKDIGVNIFPDIASEVKSIASEEKGTCIECSVVLPMEAAYCTHCGTKRNNSSDK